MRNEVYPIQMEGSQPYARLAAYIQDSSPELSIVRRPLILICPGGGYAFTSDREADPLAFKFLAMGYHAAVLRYSCVPSVYPTALLELAWSILTIRRNADEWNVDPDKIIVLGSSAGGHLAASLGVFWKEAFLTGALGLGEAEERLLRPDGMILCYPVITSGEFANRPSFRNLLNEREAELSAKMSLEDKVDSDTPPAFIWHTGTDETVPVENSLLFVGALRRAGVPVEFHLYPRGPHGLALADRLTLNGQGCGLQEECASWISLVHTWIEHWYVL